MNLWRNLQAHEVDDRRRPAATLPVVLPKLVVRGERYHRDPPTTVLRRQALLQLGAALVGHESLVLAAELHQLAAVGGHVAAEGLQAREPPAAEGAHVGPQRRQVGRRRPAPSPVHGGADQRDRPAEAAFK